MEHKIIECFTKIKEGTGYRDLRSDDFKSFGKGVEIYPLVKFAKTEVMEIGDHSRIDDFAFLYGGNGIKFGKYVYIASFVSVIGGGTLIMEDFASAGCGSRFITGTNRVHGVHISSVSPPPVQEIIRGVIKVEKDGYIGTNAVIMPNVTIGQGAIVGACAFVNKDVEPWTIVGGIPAKIIGKRDPLDYKNLDKIEKDYLERNPGW
ncbi:MAG: acyltransferase [Promethearchaeota archaeon]